MMGTFGLPFLSTGSSRIWTPPCL